MRINKLRWQRADEVDVVDVLTELGYSLSGGKMSCPAHSDRTPSMTLSTKLHNALYCFSCAASGGKKNGIYTPLGLVRLCLSKSRVQALLWIEEKFGLEALPDEPGDPSPEEEKLQHTWIGAGMNPLAEYCMDYFRRRQPETEAAYRYLKERCIASSIAMTTPIGVLPPDLDMHKIVALVDAAFSKDRQAEQAQAENDIAVCKTERRGEAAAYWERRFDREDKAVAEYKKRLFDIHKYDGTIAGFREDRYGNYIAVEFRSGKRGKDGKTQSQCSG